MSLQVVSDRKVRRAAERTGLPLDRVMAHHNHEWLGRFVIDGKHGHVVIQPRTFTVTPDDGPCWTSCDTPRLPPLARSPFAKGH